MKEIYEKYIYNCLWTYSESNSTGSITCIDGISIKTVYKGDFITSKNKFMKKIREINERMKNEKTNNL